MPNLSQDIWRDDNLLRQAFAWQTRIGIAPKFGSRPITWYQQEQCETLDKIKAAADKIPVALFEVRYSKGRIQAHQAGKWVTLYRVICGQLYLV